MKKVISLILAGIMLFAFASCSSSEENTPDDTSETPILLGGYQRAESPEITDEIKTLVEKASETLLGAEYTPVAYIASQVVAGRNHRILCQITPVVPEAVSTYAIIVIYEDLQGNATITDIFNSEAQGEAIWDEPVPGGWTDDISPIVTEEVKTAVETASKSADGVEYTPVALLAQQLVAGMNYSVLCEAKTSADALETYCILHVYAALDGSAEITDVYTFSAAE